MSTFRIDFGDVSGTITCAILATPLFQSSGIQAHATGTDSCRSQVFMQYNCILHSRAMVHNANYFVMITLTILRSTFLH